jgi:uncharacterized membrane protein YedE/YeeE
MDWLLTGHWPWWFGGPLFAVLVVGIWLIERRLLGGSASYVGLLTPTAEGEVAMRTLEDSGGSAMEDALMAATLAAFGEEAVAEFEAEEQDADAVVVTPTAPMPRSAHFTFLAMLIAGGAVGALMSGGWSVRMNLGALHNSFLGGGGVLTIAILVIGGVFVGFGTRMAGGCTTGHGLSGCSRMQPGSLVATASFFGAAVGVSFLLQYLAGS